MVKLTEEISSLKKFIEVCKKDKSAGVFLILAIILVILNLAIQDPFLGIYGSIFLLAGILLIVIDKMKGPNLMFGPNERLKAYTLVMKLIRNSQSYLKVIDLHPSEDTLHALGCSPMSISVQFLTLVINMSKTKKNAFKASAKRLMLDKPNIEIRIAEKSVFHDRWLLTEPHGWHLTQSIKDIGNKIGHFIEMSVEETSECASVFDKYWVDSQQLHQD